MLGLAVCGGLSRRMGVDKATLDLAGSGLLARAVGVLEEVAGEVLLATGSAPRYEATGLACVLDPVEDAGPLAGLVAGLEALDARGAEWLVTLPCDTPRVTPELLAGLLARARERGADACLFATERGLEPLTAAYRRTCLAPARAALTAGRRRMVAFHEGLAVATLHEHELAAPLRARDPAANVNTPEDLARERAWFGSSSHDLAPEGCAGGRSGGGAA